MSGSELEFVETQTKGVNKQLVFNAKIPSRKFCTPQSKSSSVDTRKSFSADAKRSNVHFNYENTVKCKRTLHYGSDSPNSEITLHEYAKRGVIEMIKIPYVQNRRKMAKEAIKLILLNAYGLVLDLHCESKSLKGSFTSKNFLIHLQTKKVMLQGIEPLAYSKGDTRADKSQFVIMVEGMFGNKVPEEIAIWLRCIKNGAHDNVVRSHVNMLHSNNVFGEFCLMYHALLQTKALDEKKFNDLLELLVPYEIWVSTKFSWSVLEDNRSYGRNSNQRHQDPNSHQPVPVPYSADAFGLMKFLRDCWEHPAKLYPQFLMAVLLGEFPNLLSDVQVALYDAGCLPQLDIKNMD